MSSYSNNPRLGHQQQRRGNKSSPSSIIGGSTVKTLATTAVVAYGAYKAYEYYCTEPPRQEDGEQEGETLKNTLIPQWLSSLWWLDEQEQDSSSERATFGKATAASASASSWSSSTSRKQSKVNVDPRTRHRLAQQRIRKCRQEIRTAYATCWPALQQVIDERTNTVPMTQELRTLRQQQQSQSNIGQHQEQQQQQQQQQKERQDELWQAIQLETFTKFVATTYASSLLVLSLTMQLHWIGGQVFEQQQQQQQNSDSDTGITTARSPQQVLMKSHEYFKKQGLPLLIAAVRRAIAASPMGEWRPTTLVTLEELQQALERVDAHLERGGGSNGGSPSYSRNWIRIVLPDPSTRWNDEDSDDDDDDDGDDDDDDDDERGQGKSLSYMLEALWDLAESPAWQDAQLQTLQSTHQFLRDEGWGKGLLSPVPPSPPQQEQQTIKETKDNAGDHHSSNNISPTQVPLAKLMAPFKTSCRLVMIRTASPSVESETLNRSAAKSKSKHALLSQLQKLPSVLELGDVSFQES